MVRFVVRGDGLRISAKLRLGERQTRGGAESAVVGNYAPHQSDGPGDIGGLKDWAVEVPVLPPADQFEV